MTDADTSAAALNVEALRALEPDFWRAPSPHNTQPWLLDYGEREIVLRWDPERTLPIADPTMRDNFLALGAFAETVEIVSGADGVPLRFTTDIDLAELRAGRFVAGPAYDTPFGVDDVRTRVCSRVGYEPGVVADVVLERARNAAAAGTDGVELVHVPTRELIDTLVAADKHMFLDPEITGELRSWMRLTRRHPRYTRDGLTWEAMALKRSEAGALRTLLAPPIYRPLRRAGLASLLASFAKPLLDYDGSVLVLTGPAPTDNEPATTTHATELMLGRALMRIWLQLAADGQSVHPLSEIIDAPETYAALAAHIGLAPTRRAFAIFRAGRTATAPAASSRLR